MTDPSPAAQVKTLRMLARAFVSTGLLIGIGFPAILYFMRIEVFMTVSGFDLVWIVALAIMIIDIGLATYFRRRADRIESGAPPA